MNRKFFRPVVIWVMVVCLLFSQAAFAGENTSGISDRDLEYLKTVMDMIKEKYGGEITDEELIDGALKGMFSTMDPYTTYFSKDEADSFLGEINGVYDGIGITMAKKEKYIEVTKVFADSPAEKAGIYPGDRISSIDGKDVAEASIEEAGSLIKGASDTAVVLGVTRGDSTRKIEVIRGKVSVNPVSYSIKGDIGYIRLEIFNANSSNSVIQALNEMDKRNIKKIIFDLRGNPGGDVAQAVAIARKFVPKGLITKLNFKSESTPDIEYYSYLKQTKYELAVLVNGMSASASEILAGAVQDTKAGTLIGTKTFGKAKVQSIIPVLTPEAYARYKAQLGIDIASAYDLIYEHGIMPLDDEISGYTKITTGLYTTPKGRMIDLVGIEPDIAVEDPALVNGIDVSSLMELSRKIKPSVGSEGADVYYAEKLLKALGYNIDDPDSKFDKKTLEAVKKFQKEKGGYSYGVLDFTTQQWLNDELDKLMLKTDKQYAEAVEKLK